MNKLEDLIKSKFGSIGNMLDQTDIISKPTIYKILDGTRGNPTKETLQELSKLLDTPIDDIVILIDECIKNDETKEV